MVEAYRTRSHMIEDLVQVRMNMVSSIDTDYIGEQNKYRPALERFKRKREKQRRIVTASLSWLRLLQRVKLIVMDQ